MVESVNLILDLVYLHGLVHPLLVDGDLEHILPIDQGDDGEHLLGAAQLAPGQDGGGQPRLQGEARHLPAEICELVILAHRAEQLELSDCADDVLGSWSVHEVKIMYILHTNIHHGQNDVGKIAPLNFWYSGVIQLIEFSIVNKNKSKIIIQVKL